MSNFEIYGWLSPVYLINYICSVVSKISLGGDFINNCGFLLSIKKGLEYSTEEGI